MITPHGFFLINQLLCLIVKWLLLFTVANQLFGVVIEQNIPSISRHFNTFLFKVCFITPTTLLLSTAVNKMAVKSSESFFKCTLKYSFSGTIAFLHSVNFLQRCLEWIKKMSLPKLWKNVCLFFWDRSNNQTVLSRLCCYSALRQLKLEQPTLHHIGRNLHDLVYILENFIYVVQCLDHINTVNIVAIRFTTQANISLEVLKGWMF